MWSHYADEHKGLAILYDFPEAYLDDGKTFIGTVEVTYEENSLTNWFLKMAKKLPTQLEELSIELAKIYLAVKSPDWQYEKEARIIKHEPGPLEIQKDYIKQICFGLNTPESDIDLIKEIVGHYNDKVDLM